MVLVITIEYGSTKAVFGFPEIMQGYFHYAGRRDDSFKSCGLWVSPVEIEQTLLMDDEVREAAVIAVPDNHGLIGPLAFIRSARHLSARETSELEERLIVRLSAQLPKYKVPRAIEFIQDLPRTVTGKVCRQTLRMSSQAG